MASVDGEAPAEHAETGAPTAGHDWSTFAPLYDLHEPHLYRFARLLLPGQPQLAEDAVAETFLKVYRAWADGRVENFLAYARQTLVNHILGMFRKKEASDRYIASIARGEDRGERQLDDAVVDARAVFDALATLPVRRRTALVLRYYEDLPYDEIAKTMGISVGAVKAHISAGVAQLRALMTATST